MFIQFSLGCIFGLGFVLVASLPVVSVPAFGVLVVVLAGGLKK